MKQSSFDLIGDVHGCANTLEKLLLKLGYSSLGQRNGWPVYAHSDRSVIFVGDIVDRGPRIREALHLVKNMVDEGSAQCILGNHEYNAIAYTTTVPNKPEEYVRAHNSRHNRLIAETLSQFASYPEEWREFLEWFKTLPLYLEFPLFRVVHACWDTQLIAEFEQRYRSRCIDTAFVHQTLNLESLEFKLLDRLTRGTDISLPDGRKITGRDGLERSFFRTKFWADEPETYKDVVFQPDPLPDDLNHKQLSRQQKAALLSYHDSEKPVFVGHYWLQGNPKPLKPNLACLDYSAVKYGKLVCYRFDGEQILDNSKFVWVNVEPDN
ncbi:metallophosphoesterase [Teredinibacter waterburyi]|jgi:Calcineurin-like phosphoesterase.|uniref:metallophosphoesterase n=1 Tax=Teredinibacter waterburyi TaxID=1500538 RepID=UPI00165FF4CE|nr:metallophosphoesterase [Teredinibacter waterburyi]